MAYVRLIFWEIGRNSLVERDTFTYFIAAPLLRVYTQMAREADNVASRRNNRPISRDVSVVVNGN